MSLIDIMNSASFYCKGVEDGWVHVALCWTMQFDVKRTATVTLRCTKALLLAEGPLVGAKRLEMASNTHACLHNTGVVSWSIS